MRIDLNADLGESWPRWESGEDVALLDVVTSANVCCGAYAGDADLMRATCEAAVARGVAIGAQVGYPDRDNFGASTLDMPSDELTGELLSQILLLDDIARAAGGSVAYVKPHGALYNRIVDDDVQAQAVVDAIQGLATPLPLLGLPGSVSLSIAEACRHPGHPRGIRRSRLHVRRQAGAAERARRGARRSGRGGGPGRTPDGQRLLGLRAQRQPGRRRARPRRAGRDGVGRCRADERRGVNLRPYGDTALLLDCESLDEAQGWFAALHGDVEAVLGARSVLLRGDPRRCGRSSSGTAPADPAARPRRAGDRGAGRL